MGDKNLTVLLRKKDDISLVRGSVVFTYLYCSLPLLAPRIYAFYIITSAICSCMPFLMPVMFYRLGFLPRC